jgi:hypothetical protein
VYTTSAAILPRTEPLPTRRITQVHVQPDECIFKSLEHVYEMMYIHIG